MPDIILDWTRTFESDEEADMYIYEQTIKKEDIN